MRDNSMSVREDLKITVFAMRSSLTLSWNSPSSCTAPLMSDTLDFVDAAFDDVRLP